MAHRGIAVKTLKKLLKKAGMKTTGKKATLTRRAKKAKLMKGGLFGFFEGKTPKGRCMSNGMPGACVPTTTACKDGSSPAYDATCD
jgi:hypothetical protein